MPTPILTSLAGHTATSRRGFVVTALAVVSLALGIAGNAVVYSLVDSLLNLRLPYTDPDRVVLVGQRESGAPDAALASLLSSLPVWADYRERSLTLVDWATIALEFRNVSDGERALGIMVGMATPSFFRVLGEQTELGRVFAEAEGVPGGPKIALLNWDYWQNSLGARADVVGSTITLDGIGHDIVGVLPDGYDFLTPEVSIWVPLQADPYDFPRGQRRAISVARMAPGVAMADVRTEIQSIARELEAEYPETFRGWTMSATNLGEEFPDPQSRVYMGVLRGAVFFVLLIACANIANLLLARSQERKREIAVRTALGASRLHILARLARESLVLALVGGAIGLVLTALATWVLGNHLETLPFVPDLFHPRLDGSVVAFTAAMTLVCGILVGTLPAAQAFRVDQVETLKLGGGMAGPGRAASRIATGLVVAQISLSLIALGAGVVLTQSFLSTVNRDPGFDPNGLLTAGMEIAEWKHTRQEGTDLLEQVRERVAGLTGVRGATLVTPLPKNLAVQSEPFFVGLEVGDSSEAPQAQRIWVSPTFLETFGVPLVRGRFFSAADNEDARPVVVVNRALADRRFPGGQAVGAQLHVGGAAREIVGVVGDTQQGIVPNLGSGEAVYVPLAQNHRTTIYLVVRTDGPPRRLIEPIRNAAWGLDPDLAINTTETFQEYATRYTVMLSIFNEIFSAFGVLALLLASLGTYGVIAYSVAQRRREIGVRLTLGAEPRGVVGMMAGHGLKMTLLGLAIGAALLVPLLMALETVLVAFALSPPSPGTLVWVGLALLAVGAIASIVPATRAATVDPVSVLRSE